MIIYLVTNIINGKEYVGQTIEVLLKRRRAHITAALRNNDNIYFHKTIKKYGSENFDWEVLHDDITNIDDLNKLEVYYIELYDTFNSGYNLTKGGDSTVGFKHSKETISKMCGRKFSEEHKRRIAEGGRNRLPASEKTRERLSKASSGKNNGMYGKNHSVKIKNKLSLNHSIPIIINKQYFPSTLEASILLKISRRTIKRRIDHKTKWVEYKLYKTCKNIN